MSGEVPTYRLPERRPGGVVFGLTVPQVTFAAAAVMALVFVPARMRSAGGLVAGLGLAGMFAAIGFVPVGGRPLHDALVTAVAFAARRVRGRQRWVAPLPVLTAGSGRRRVPACLAGLEVRAVERPEWAGGVDLLTPVGLVADRQAGTLTGVLEIRGDAFSLLDPADRRYRLAGWSQVLSRFAVESSPVVRLGWALWSAPVPLDADVPGVDEGPDVSEPVARAAAAYRRLIADAGTGVTRHDLRVWLTIDTRRLARRVDPADTALAAMRSLSERSRAAGLAVTPPASPAQIAEAVRCQADPAAATAVPRIRRGLADHAGLAVAHLWPIGVEVDWDAVRVDGAWHRVFWVAQWPTLAIEPGWLDPLLFAAPAVRTVAVVMEPVAPRTSRRRINADTVTIEGQLGMRERHSLRVPVELARAHDQVDQRDAELAAGFAEFGYLGLVDVAAPSRLELEEACQATADLAAQCGVTELRPLNGRHDLAWAATLPVGRVPRRPIFGGRL